MKWHILILLSSYLSLGHAMTTDQIIAQMEDVSSYQVISTESKSTQVEDTKKENPLEIDHVSLTQSASEDFVIIDDSKEAFDADDEQLNNNSPKQNQKTEVVTPERIPTVDFF